MAATIVPHIAFDTGLVVRGSAVGRGGGHEAESKRPPVDWT